jgi:hypothetical protein
MMPGGKPDGPRRREAATHRRKSPWRLSPFPFASLPVVASGAALDHFVAPLIARHDEGSEIAAAKATPDITLVAIGFLLGFSLCVAANITLQLTEIGFSPYKGSDNFTAIRRASSTVYLSPVQFFVSQRTIMTFI